ncbi:MAG: hypothetical protein JKY92_09250 [Magnetovibrio sp.]|nr:hypothetical protein [Magnetovibrio sp.]
MTKRVLCLLTTVTVLASLCGSAQAKSKEEVIKSHARISPTLIWVNKPGSLIMPTQAVYPILTVPEVAFEDGRLAKVCQNEPRVKEAIVAYFQRNPAPLLRNGYINVDFLEKKKYELAAQVNAVLRKRAGIIKPLISQIVILAQDPDKNVRKGVMSRFPSARGCSRVANEFIELMKNRVLGGSKGGGEGGGG